MVVYKLKGNVFDAPDSFALAHCIAADAGMSGGIAAQFIERFKQREKIKDILDGKYSNIGFVVPLNGNDVNFQNKPRLVYNLVTKVNTGDDPTLDDLELSLISMKNHMNKNGEYDVAMPRIGTGIDGLSLSSVLKLICKHFHDDIYRILIYEGENLSSREATPRKKKSKKNK